MSQVSGSTSTITIEGCNFRSNLAFDAYAIYIENADATVTYKIVNNKFTNNFNGDTTQQSTGAVIASEVKSLNSKEILSMNEFSNDVYGKGCEKLYFVDQKGDKLPDPTPLPSPTLPLSSTTIEWDEKKEDNNIRCDKEMNPEKEEERNVVVIIKTTEFNTMTNEKGAAIHLKNCGLSCTNKCKFINCKSENSEGGAIYVNNSIDLLNDVTLEGLSFEKCSATIGGAIYIQSSSVLNTVTIKKCYFTGNEATSNDGGSAIIMSTMKGIMSLCKFKSNLGPGSTVKLVNDFELAKDSSSLIKLFDEKEIMVSVSECKFEINKEFSSSVFYVAGRDGANYEIKNCIFTGIVTKNAHHIDGVRIDKKGPCVVVKDCKFSGSMKRAFDTSKGFSNIELRSQVFGFNEKKNDDSYVKFTVLTAVPAAILVVVVVAVVVKKFGRMDNNGDQIEVEEDINVSEGNL